MATIYIIDIYILLSLVCYFLTVLFYNNFKQIMVIITLFVEIISVRGSPTPGGVLQPVACKSYPVFLYFRSSFVFCFVGGS